MDYRPKTCNYCQRNGHIARFCSEQMCTNCGRKGHHDRDCQIHGEVKVLRIWMPFNREVRMAVSKSPTREYPEIGPNLQLMTGAPDVSLNGSTFSTKKNALKIEYGGEESIVIALQDAKTEAETLVQLRPNYVQGFNMPIVRIGAKFFIENRVLHEKIDRLAKGTKDQSSPQGDTYVLLFIDDMLQSTIVADINGEKYYLEWTQQVQNRQFRADVSVFSRHTYQHRLANETRDLIRDGKYYFHGNTRAAQIQIAQPNPDDNEQVRLVPTDESVQPQVAALTQAAKSDEELEIETKNAEQLGAVGETVCASDTVEIGNPYLFNALQQFEIKYDESIAAWYNAQ